MPYYICPKCGSKDSYSGTEIVSEHKHKSGHMIAGQENSLGMTPVMRVGGSSHTEHKQLTVEKCKRCDILLGEKDLHYTKEERLEMRLEEVRIEKASMERSKVFFKFCLRCLIVGLIGQIAVNIGNLFSHNDLFTLIGFIFLIIAGIGFYGLLFYAIVKFFKFVRRRLH